jgi:carbonic anhydrase
MKSFTFISLLGVLGSSIQITSFNYGFDVQDEQTWNDDNGICLTGTMQSPIDIPLDTGTGLTELEFAYAYQYFDNTTSTILYETTETLELTYTSGLSNVWSNAGIS